MCTMKQASFSPYSKTEIEQVLASLNMQILRMAAHLFKTLKRWKHQEMSEMFFLIFQIEVFFNYCSFLRTFFRLFQALSHMTWMAHMKKSDTSSSAFYLKISLFVWCWSDLCDKATVVSGIWPKIIRIMNIAWYFIIENLIR